MACSICLYCISCSGFVTPNTKNIYSDHARFVHSADGVLVPIDEPYQGTALFWCSYGVNGYLEQTRAPQTVLMAGGTTQRKWFGLHDMMSRIYPMFKNDRFWDMKIADIALKDKTNVEVLASYNAGAYIGDCGEMGMIPLLRQAGCRPFMSTGVKRIGMRQSFPLCAQRTR